MDTLDQGLRRNGLAIDNNGKRYLKDVAKWAKFLAIVFMVVCALMVIGGIVASITIGSMAEGAGMPYGSVIIGLAYVLIAALYIYPTWNLYQFATKCTRALSVNDNQLLSESFKGLKNCFQFMGILTLIGLLLYGLMFLIGIFGGLAGLVG